MFGTVPLKVALLLCNMKSLKLMDTWAARWCPVCLCYSRCKSCCLSSVLRWHAICCIVTLSIDLLILCVNCPSRPSSGGKYKPVVGDDDEMFSTAGYDLLLSQAAAARQREDECWDRRQRRRCGFCYLYWTVLTLHLLSAWDWRPLHLLRQSPHRAETRRNVKDKQLITQAGKQSERDNK